MSKESVATYKYEVWPLKEYSTQYTWVLNNWSLMYDLIYKEGVTSSDFDLNGIDGCTCKIFLTPKTPEYLLTVEFSVTQDIEALEIDITTGNYIWHNTYRRPIKNIHVYSPAGKKDFSNGISKIDKNGAVVILVKINIVKVSDSVSLLDQMSSSLQMLRTCDPSQDILANFKSMFDRKTLCDVTFVVGDETFDAHKALLAAQSKVFEAMFLSGMKEQSDTTIEISNYDAKLFKQFLNHLYGGEEIPLEEIVEEMIVIADYYDVSELKSKCESTVVKSLSEKTAVRYVILVDKTNCDILKKAALCMIRNNTKIIEKALLEEDIATIKDLKEILCKADQPEA